MNVGLSKELGKRQVLNIDPVFSDWVDCNKKCPSYFTKPNFVLCVL